MKHYIRFMNSMLVFMSGCLASSMWITHSEHWKAYVTICIIIIALRNFFKPIES